MFRSPSHSRPVAYVGDRNVDSTQLNAHLRSALYCALSLFLESCPLTHTATAAGRRLLKLANARNATPQVFYSCVRLEGPLRSSSLAVARRALFLSFACRAVVFLVPLSLPFFRTPSISSSPFLCMVHLGFPGCSAECHHARSRSRRRGAWRSFRHFETSRMAMGCCTHGWCIPLCETSTCRCRASGGRRMSSICDHSRIPPMPSSIFLANVVTTSRPYPSTPRSIHHRCTSSARSLLGIVQAPERRSRVSPTAAPGNTLSNTSRSAASRSFCHGCSTVFALL
ncbi:hypothetical protein BC628DRAFT_712025 [Trametes gibbosa]|nr:hypothetical protein BC628DRAFT_712025 [Trametes gibbosa]